MEVLIHFAFQIVKISILGLFYLGVILLIINVSSKSSISFFRKIKTLKKSKIVVWFVICLALFIWQFTYWGDHGLGDYSRVPLGKGKEIEQMNYNGMYIRPVNQEEGVLSIEYYSINKGYCFGLISKSNKFFIWNLDTNEIRKFSSQNEYVKERNSRNLSSKIVFRDFEEVYDAYWGGWRFWLLP